MIRALVLLLALAACGADGTPSAPGAALPASADTISTGI